MKILANDNTVFAEGVVVKNYQKNLRKIIGHMPILVCGASVIVVDNLNMTADEAAEYVLGRAGLHYEHFEQNSKM